MEARLILVEAIAHEPETASRQVQNIEHPAGALLRTLSYCLQSLPTIPEELIHFTASCFRRLHMPEYHFLIAVADTDRVAMHNLKDMVVHTGFRDALPQFFALFEESDVGGFVILQIPERMLDRENCLEWAVIAHEVGHAYVEQNDVVSRHFPRFAHLGRHQLHANVRDKDPDAIRHAFLTEYACDEIAVRTVGCAYAWQLFSGFYSLGRLDAEGSHPPMDARVKRACEIAGDLGFRDRASKIDMMLGGEGIVAGQTPDPRSAPTKELLKTLSDDLSKRIDSVSLGELERCCEEHLPSLRGEQADALISAGRPLALPEWAVLTLATPNEAIAGSGKRQQAIADAIRLGQINEQLLQIARKTPASVP